MAVFFEIGKRIGETAGRRAIAQTLKALADQGIYLAHHSEIKPEYVEKCREAMERGYHAIEG